MAMTTVAMSARRNRRPAARPRASRQPPGSSSHDSGLSSIRLWLAQPKRCSVPSHTKAITVPSSAATDQNTSAMAAADLGRRDCSHAHAAAMARPAISQRHHARWNSGGSGAMRCGATCSSLATSGRPSASFAARRLAARRIGT